MNPDEVDKLLQHCPTCGHLLLHNLVDQGGGKFCPTHGELVLTRVVGREHTVTLKVDIHFPRINLS